MLDIFKNRSAVGVLLCAAVLILLSFSLAFYISASEITAVYVSDSGSDLNSGTDAAAPLKTLGSAYKKLSSGGTVTVVGKLTVGGELPESGSKITVKGQTPSSQLVMTGDILLSSDTVFEHLTFNANAGSFFIVGRGHDLCLGDGITTTKGTGAYPSVVGGVIMTDGMTAEDASFFGYTVEINSGSYNYVYGSNRRTSDKQAMGVTGDVRLIINGGSYNASGSGADDIGVIGVGSYASQDGDYYLEINGGSFNCGVYGIARPGINQNKLTAYYRGDLYMKITGGNFRSSGMGAVQTTLASYVDGDFFMEITGGSFPSGLKRISAEGVRGKSTYSVIDALYSRMYAFARTVFISPSGNDSYSGTTETSAVRSIEKAVELLDGRGGTLVLCGKINLPKGFDFGSYDSSLLITGRLGSYDASSRAILTLNESVSFGSSVRIDDLRIVSHADAEIRCAADLYIADSVQNSGGKLSVTGTDPDGARRIELYGGTYSSVDGADGSSISIFLGGGVSVDALTVSGQVSGNVYAYLGDCILSGSITVTDASVTGMAGLVLDGADIRTDRISVCESGSIGGEFGLQIFGVSASQSISLVGVNACTASYIKTADADIDTSALTEITGYKFVSESGTGEGESIGSAQKTLRTAVMALGKGDGGRIVICEPYTVESLDTLPYDAKVTLSSVFCGVDYREINRAKIELYGRMSFFGEVEFDGIEIETNALYTEICANTSPLAIGYDVTCTAGRDKGVETYPDIVAGTRVEAKTNKKYGDAPISLTLNGGAWNSVTAGNLRSEGGAATLRTSKGMSEVNIGGGIFYGSVRTTGMSNVEGELCVNITGGSFMCPVYLIASPVTVDGDISNFRGNISLNISGGDFHSDIDIAENEAQTTFDGTYTLSVTGGDLRCVGEIIGADGMTGENSSVIKVSEDFNYEGESTGTVRFKNPVVIDAADPSVYVHDGMYLYTRTGYYRGKPAIYTSCAANLPDIGAAVSHLMWYADTDTNIDSLWAPQLYFFDGEFYIYASCSVEGDDRRYPYVWKCTDPDDLFAGAMLLGRVENYDKSVDTWLSPRLMQYEGKLYYISAAFMTASDRTQTNYKERMIIGVMSTPTSFLDEKVYVIADPDREWEGYDIMEGAYPLVAPDGTLYISYAANYTDKNDYCTGLLKLVGDDLTKASSWEKQDTPLQMREHGSGIFGPGATVYAQSPDGSETWAVYHVKTHADNVYACRHIVLERVEWDENSYPVLGYPEGLWQIHEITVNRISVSDRVRGFGSVQKLPAQTDGLTPQTGGYTFSRVAVCVVGCVCALLCVSVCAYVTLPSGKKKNTGKNDAIDKNDKTDEKEKLQ